MTHPNTDPCLAEAARIAAHSDAFRHHVCLGQPWPDGIPPLAGKLVFTQSLAACGLLFVQTCIRTVGTACIFTQDNDPEGHHDFGAFEITGTRVYWKIDAYDQDFKYGSDDPSNPAITARVLTIMLPSDW